VSDVSGAFILKGQGVEKDGLLDLGLLEPWKMKSSCAFEMLGATHPETQCHICNYLTPQLHHCGDLKSFMNKDNKTLLHLILFF
jgi:hypothetical protein